MGKKEILHEYRREYSEYYPSVYSYLYSKLKNRDDTEDIPFFAYGGYLIYDNCNPQMETVNNIPNDTIINESQSLGNKKTSSTFYCSEKLSLQVLPFVEKNVSANLSNEVLNVFQKELKFAKTVIARNKLLDLKYLLTGSLIELNKNLVLFVKVIDSNSSEIVYTSSNKVESRMELLRTSKQVASEIPQYLKNNP